MKNPGTEDHGVIRSDFPGGWNGDKENAFTGNISKEQLEIQAFVKKLLNWRKTANVIHDGDLKHYAPEDGVYVYFRYNDEDKVMILFNKSSNSASVEVSRFRESLDSDYISGIDVISENRIEDVRMLEAPARGCLIIEID